MTGIPPPLNWGKLGVMFFIMALFLVILSCSNDGLNKPSEFSFSDVRSGSVEGGTYEITNFVGDNKIATFQLVGNIQWDDTTFTGSADVVLTNGGRGEDWLVEYRFGELHRTHSFSEVF